jgi:hypothetical protein
MARNDGLILHKLVEEIARYEEADEVLNDVSNDLHCLGEVSVPTKIRLDKYLGIDDSE